ncbi:MAG TPA: TIR domain-containing protein [Lacunisphaera sp.]|nr:TIR domain-containing protein [Lacunisphaera sp.]
MSEPAKAIFLSYAREDAGAARRIAEALRAAGLEVWFDENELRGGDTWDAKIRGQIGSCALFLPIISAQTQSRAEGYFRREWKLADHRTEDMGRRRAFLVPVCIDDTKDADADVPDSFLKVQWTRLPGALPTPQFVEQVKRLLEQPLAAGGSGSRPTTVAGVADPGNPASTRPATKKAPPIALVIGLGSVLVSLVLIFVVARRDKPSPEPKTTPPAATPDPKPQTPDPSLPPKADAKSIAVLPFENRSESKADLFFTDGVHDDLLTQISRIKDIKTISRTSVMTYRGSAKKIREIAGELGVATILEGGVQRAGNQVRINVQLIDARTDAHLWAETYTRELTAENIFAIQSEISVAIAKALSAVLSPAEQEQLGQRPTANLAALEQYFAANALVADGSTEKLARAVSLYEDAIRIDPGFAPAYARLAEVQMNQVYFSGAQLDAQLAKAEPLIARALQLDPRLSEAHEASGTLRWSQKDVAGARAAYERAIELKPNNAGALASLARLLFWGINERETGLALATRARELNPEDMFTSGIYGWFLAEMGRLDEARETFDKALRRHPDNAWILGSAGMIYVRTGEVLKGVVALRRAYALDPGSSAVADWLLLVSIDYLGEPEWTKFWLERCAAITRVGKVPLDIRLRLLINRGQLDAAHALWMQEWQSDERSTAPVMLWELMLADLKAGRKTLPRSRYLLSNPELFVPGTKVPDQIQTLFRAKDVALALIAVGEQAQADHLLREAETLARKHTDWTHRFVLAKIQLARQDRAAFLQTMRGMVEQKDSLEKIYIDPEISAYRNDPEFEAMFGDLPRQRAELIATLRRMDASGELAPIPPLPEVKK